MPGQAQIEKAAGIDKEVAEFMMKKGTAAAAAAMGALQLCVDFYEPCAFALLKEAVNECKKDMALIK